MGKISNSMDLAKASLGVLKQDKELAAIPIASAVSCGIIAVLFGGGAYFTLEHVVNPAPGQNEYNASPLTYAVGIVGLFVIGMVAQFFAAVLVAGANERLEGGNPTLGSAFAKASSRGGSIIGWSAMNSTVGLILSAWNIITWLAVPIIIVEGVGPIAAVKRSAQLLRQTWGENLLAQAGLGIVGLLVILPGVLVFGVVSVVIPLVGIPLLVLYIGIVASILTALGAIYRTALYRFAVGLPIGETFPEQALAGAFRTKGSGPSRFLR
jgi:hypothetical protein